MADAATRQRIKSLLEMREDRGCSPAEAATARQIAERLMAKHGLTEADCSGAVEAGDLHDALKRWAAEENERRRKAAEEERAERWKEYARSRSEQRAVRFKSIGEAIIWLIKNTDMDNARIAEWVRSKRTDARTTPSSVAWYRSKIKRGEL